MRFLTKPRLTAISWNVTNFLILRAAAETANHERRDKFTVDLGKKYGEVEFYTGFALNLCDKLAMEFSKAKRDYPENREGAEP